MADELIPVFMPSLGSWLIRAEDVKGEPLTYDEVIRLRDKAPCIMMTVDDVRKLEESRGYRDIDPENCWYEWQMLRRDLGRKPDLDPGAKLNQIRSSDPDYQKTIQDAHATLDQFRSMLPVDGSPRHDTMVKMKIVDGEQSAFMWLSRTRIDGQGFSAKFFEIPPFTKYKVGDELQISESELLDWIVNDGGQLYGGFSIRYYRSTLPESDRAEYDEYIDVTEYL